MAKKQEEMSRKALMLLVVAVLVVSLVGTWLVLQSGFASNEGDNVKGTISFSKTGNTFGNALVERNPDSAGKVSFVKEG